MKPKARWYMKRQATQKEQEFKRLRDAKDAQAQDFTAYNRASGIIRRVQP